MTKIKCNFGFHNWTKWKEYSVKVQQFSSPIMGSKYMGEGYLDFQKRECLECGKIQQEKILL